MGEEHRVFYCLPVYNEEQNIIPLLTKIEHYQNKNNSNFKILLMDDGSSDKTVERIEEFINDRPTFPVHLFKHKTNKGLGITIKDLLTQVADESSNSDLIVTMDADNTHDPSLVSEMESKMEPGSFDLIIASRFTVGGREVGVPNTRKFLSRVLNFFLRVAFPIEGALDYTSGFRMYKAGIIKKAKNKYGDSFITEKGFSCQLEILLKLRPLINGVKEVPICLRYDKKIGNSKMKVLNTISSYLKLIISFVRVE